MHKNRKGRRKKHCFFVTLLYIWKSQKNPRKTVKNMKFNKVSDYK